MGTAVPYAPCIGWRMVGVLLTDHEDGGKSERFLRNIRRWYYPDYLVLPIIFRTFVSRRKGIVPDQIKLLSVMTKTQAMLNFQAVTNYLMWKYSNLICTTINQECKYFECRMHFDPDELNADLLRAELNEIRDSQSRMMISKIKDSSKMCVELEWWYKY